MAITRPEPTPVKRIVWSLLVLSAPFLGAACRPVASCEVDADCAAPAHCQAGSCLIDDDTAFEGEGEHVDATGADALVVVRGVEALAGARVTLPIELHAADITLDAVGVEDCTAEVAEIDHAAVTPVTLTLQCTRLHLGELTLPVVVHHDDAVLEVTLAVRFVPSDWLDLERTLRELITVDVTGVLGGAPVPVGAPVFVGAERLPVGWAAASPRLLAVDDDGGVVDVPVQADGQGLWFALPASASVWLYYQPITGVVAAAPSATPWSSFVGVWHLDNEGDPLADAADTDGTQTLDGDALPTAGVVGGAAGFTGVEGLFTELALSPTSGALSAWMLLDGATLGAYQAAVSVGSDAAEGTFDPEAAALYASEVEQACGHLGAGATFDSAQRCSTVSPAAMSDGRWHHVAWRWHDDERELVVDGTSFTRTGETPTTFELEVLAIGSAVDGEYGWVGAVDEVRLAPSALPASWFKVEHASVVNLTTASERSFVEGLRPDVVVASEVVTPTGDHLPPVSVVPTFARGVLVAFVAARGEPAAGAGFDDVTMTRLAPSAVGSELSLTALAWEGALNGAPLAVTHDGPAPAQAVVGTVAFGGGTASLGNGVRLAMEPVVTSGPQLAMAATAPSAPAAWILVAVASRAGVARCDACGRRVLGPIEAGPDLVLDVFAGEREPSAHVLAPVTTGDDAAAVVVVRVGP